MNVKFCYTHIYIVYVSVLCPPTFLLTPDSKEVTEGKHAKFLCKAYGKPMPQISWYKDDSIVSGDDRMKVQNKDNSRKFEVESELQTTRVLLGDECQTYIVKAENKVGSVSHEFSLIGNDSCIIRLKQTLNINVWQMIYYLLG